MLPKNDDVPPWPSRVPPGVPGAGWLIAIVFAFAVTVLADWWWQGSRIATAAPASHHTTQVH